MISLKTERLIISDHTPDDLAAMHTLLSDPIAMYYLPDIKTNGVEECNKVLSEKRIHTFRNSHRCYKKIQGDEASNSSTRV